MNVPAVPVGDGTYSADTTSLEALRDSAIPARMTAIGDELVDHLVRLKNTIWTGNAKDQAVQSVSSFTTTAQSRVDHASLELTTYINDQPDALRAADK